MRDSFNKKLLKSKHNANVTADAAVSSLSGSSGNKEEVVCVHLEVQIALKGKEIAVNRASNYKCA